MGLRMKMANPIDYSHALLERNKSNITFFFENYKNMEINS